jgi:hypothetical protein
VLSPGAVDVFVGDPDADVDVDVDVGDEALVCDVVAVLLVGTLVVVVMSCPLWFRQLLSTDCPTVLMSELPPWRPAASWPTKMRSVWPGTFASQSMVSVPLSIKNEPPGTKPYNIAPHQFRFVQSDYVYPQQTGLEG